MYIRYFAHQEKFSKLVQIKFRNDFFNRYAGSRDWTTTPIVAIMR